MSAMRAGRPRGGATSLLALLTSLFLALGLLSATPAAARGGTSSDAVATSVGDIVKTADLSKFQAGNIISDAVFFARGTMSEQQIQTFLERKVPTCRSGYTCLKDWYDTSRATAADPMCGAYAGGARERASTIIYKVAQACGINPQVILATLQKEQSLVLHTSPSTDRFKVAMGQACPDTGKCDVAYYGFFNQVYGAARQFKRYANPPGTSNYFTWYAPGKTWNIRWSPTSSCGSSPVFVQNQATANLYYYTPYQPNAASIRAGYGEGDGCSSYGNRNFYQYFTDWFGSTQVPADPCAVPAAGELTAAGGEFTVNVTALNGRRAPSTECAQGVVSLKQGTVVTRVATYGSWWQVRLNGVMLWLASQYLIATPAPAYTTSRIAGVDRYQTAVGISQAAYPNGARTVLLASGEDFPDALTAGAAAGYSGAALLLTPAAALTDAVKAELSRLAPTRIVITGGPTRISAAVETALNTLLPGAAVERIAGVDRFETSRLIAAAFFPGAKQAYIATGAGFADAEAAGAIGAAKGWPVILVDGSGAQLDAASSDFLKKQGITTLVIAGGVPSVNAAVENGIKSLGVTVQRLGGVDRYSTSRLLAASAYPNGATNALLATGSNYPDALAGSVLAARRGGPLLTSPTGCMAGTVKDWLVSGGVKSLTLLGSTPSLGDAVAGSVRC